MIKGGSTCQNVCGSSESIDEPFPALLRSLRRSNGGLDEEAVPPSSGQ